MKKFTLILAGLMMSGAASAVTLDGSGDVTIIQCPALNEDVAINLTTGVVAGVTCNDTALAMAACHTSGKLTQRSVGQKEGVIGTDPDTGDDILGTVSCTVGDADPDCASTPVTGAAMAFASTGQGTVTTQYPGTGDCDSTKAEAVAQVATP